MIESGAEGADHTVELVHESLIDRWPTLARWLAENQEDAAFLARLRSAAQEWETHVRNEGLLWRGAPAQEAQLWYARGRNELVVSSADGSGNTTAEAARATVEYAPYMLLHPRGLELDELYDRLFVADPGAPGLVAIDLETGAPMRIDLQESIDWTILPQVLSFDAAAGRGVGLFHDAHCDGSSGHEFWTTVSIDMETSSFDYANYFSAMPDCTALYDELEEYDSTVVIAPGPDAFFAAHEECWYEYVDEVRLRKCNIDIRERLLSNGYASGPGVVLCTNAECSVVNMIPDRSPAAGTSDVLVLVAESTPAGTAFEVHAVDPVMGSQASIATIRTDWNGTELRPGAMTLDQTGDRLLMLARDLDHRVYVIGVDLASGAQRLLIARSATADGIELKGAADVVHDPRRDRLIVSVPYYGLFALDLETGLATALFRPTVGEGPLPLCGRSSAQEPGRPQRHCDVSTFDAQRQRFFVHEAGDEGSRIYVVDITTGNRRLLAESAMEYVTPRLFADAPEDRLLILQDTGALYEIDGTTGAQTEALGMRSWSPDGSRNVMARWIAAADTESPRNPCPRYNRRSWVSPRTSSPSILACTPRLPPSIAGWSEASSIGSWRSWTRRRRG
jgi:hypothetical protein